MAAVLLINLADTGVSGIRAQTLGGSHLAHLIFYTKNLTMSVINGLCSTCIIIGASLFSPSP